MTPQGDIPELPPPASAPRISVVIVSFNREASLRRSLEMLGAGHQVVVVDNGSSDGAGTLSEEFPDVNWSRLPKNFGLTRALNIGTRAAEGTCVLYLHDDTLIEPDSVSRLADYLDNQPAAAAVCPVLTDEAGNRVPQVGALPCPSEPYPEVTPAQGDGEITTEFASGAAIMFRAHFLRALRQIDERYGQYGGDIELCAQARGAGKKILVLSDIKAVHQGLPSSLSRRLQRADHATGTAVYLGKHYGAVNSLLWRLKTAAGAILTFRFAVATGALTGQKVDGTG